MTDSCSLEIKGANCLGDEPSRDLADLLKIANGPSEETGLDQEANSGSLHKGSSVFYELHLPNGAYLRFGDDFSYSHVRSLLTLLREIALERTSI